MTKNSNAVSVSVVMSVYNGEHTVASTIESILSQEGVEFEFIIVNDGSTDGSGKIIESYAASDSRIKLIDQHNLGLTRALINGCMEAKGQYIARQDCGDISLAKRLLEQKKVLDQQSGVVMVSCSTQFFSPLGDYLYTNSQTEIEAREGLKRKKVDQIKGPPHHGSVMFRTNVYKKVGGYRKEFKVAQDIDLWTRLVEYGDHYSLSFTSFYNASFEKSSISSTKRELQFKTAEFIIECMKARELGLPEDIILQKLEQQNSKVKLNPQSKRVSDSKYYYMLGSILGKRQAAISRQYLLESIKLNPLNWRALLKLVILFVKRT